MSNEITKEPEIRFDGYEGDWEERKVGDFLTESKIAGSNGAEANKLTVKLWSKGVVPKSEVYQGSEATQYYIRKAGQFMYGKLDFLNQAFGIVPEELNGYESTLDSPAFDFSENLNSYFFLEYVSRKSFYQYQGMIANGSRKAKRIHSDTFFDMPLILPLKREQDKIAEFIINLDRTIALHQRELDLLEQTKQTYLKKMFPKTGEDKPEICFAGFTDAWEQRMLGDVFSERSERSSEGELISVTINSGVVKASELDRKDNSSNDKSNYKKVEVGDIAYNSMRMWQGASGYSSYDGILSPAYTVIIPKEGIDSKFFAYDFKRHDMIQTFKRNSQGLTSDTWNLKFPTLKSVKVMVPCMEEQTKISNFFERLDTTITLHQRELDSLKEMKKTLLQKMFV
ncbi:restriction endonuclease subunit S [Enterococcus hirae]|nr:restriction endonuclease subunit S [Enterococcus hirae]